MFGNKKMYKRGLEDALLANEGFSRKQEAALEALRNEVANGNIELEAGLAKLGDDIHGIYRYLTAKEKAALYHLSTPVDLKKLDESESQLLVAILFQLASDEGSDVTEYQQIYLRGIQAYLGITNPQTSIEDMSVVGDIDSGTAQKAMLQSVLEFLYLQDSDILTDAQAAFLDNFSVSKKQGMAIEESVSRLYAAVGAQGVAEKYGVQNLEQVSREATDTAIKKLTCKISLLSDFPSFFIRYGFIDYNVEEITVWAAGSRGFTSKSESQKAAKRFLDKAAIEAEKNIKRMTRTSGDDCFYGSFKGDFSKRADDLIQLLDKLRTSQVADIIDKMKSYISVSAVYEKARNVNESLCNKINFGDSSHYYSFIEYDEYDNSSTEEGLLKLFAKAFNKYGYNCSDAREQMQTDMEELLSSFQEDFRTQMEEFIVKTIVEPVQALVPQLKDAMIKNADNG